MRACQATPAWKPSPQQQSVPAPGPPSSELLVSFVRSALENKLKGNAGAYNKMVTSITTHLEGDAYARWFSALCRCVSVISAERAHQQLLQAILSFHWNTTDEAIDAYRRLLVDLVCSSGRFLPMCFTGLVKQLRLHAHDGDGVFAVESPELAAKIHDNIHLVLKSILDLIPTASTALFPILCECYPHIRFAPSHHIAYTRNLLRVASYANGIGDRIVELLGRKLVLLDNELSEADFVKAPVEPVAALNELILATDGSLNLRFDVVDDAVAEPDQAAPYSTDASSLPQLVDQTMEMLMAYMDGLRASPDLSQTMFATLLRVFESHMLTSHNCRHAPFLVLYVASFNQTFAEALLRYLIERTFDQFQSVHVRIACARYLGAFLTRANFIRYATRMHAFEMMLRFVHAEVENHDEKRMAGSDLDSAGGDAAFYAVAETLFQIFCWFQYDFQALVDESPELVELFRFPSIVESGLNPLRHCRDDVAAEFATVVLSLGLGDCYPVIRRNTMLAQGQAGSSSSSSSFPFEPVVLIGMRRYLKEIYNERRDCR